MDRFSRNSHRYSQSAEDYRYHTDITPSASVEATTNDRGARVIRREHVVAKKIGNKMQKGINTVALKE